jgi:hypothetical protein
VLHNGNTEAYDMNFHVTEEGFVCGKMRGVGERGKGKGMQTRVLYAGR